MLRCCAFVFALALWTASLPAVTVETTLLGTQSGPPPLTTGDALGNVYLLVPPTNACSILQDCTPYTLVKLDAAGRVLFRRQLGDPATRIQPVAIAADRDGNVLIASVTPDPGLPLVRPLQAKFGGVADIYLWQLSPDGQRTLFASYLGGDLPEQAFSLSIDALGFAVLSLQTQSSNFPFTAVEGQATLPAGQPRQAVVRFSPATGRVGYAIGLPPGPPASFASGPDGTVVVVSFDPALTPAFQLSRAVAREIQPDGTRRQLPLTLPPGAFVSRVLPAGDGGLWIAGQVSGDVLPTTPGALRAEPSTSPYQRWEGDQIITPAGPIRGLAPRQLAVDRGDENRVYAATSRGLARTDDNGWTWDLVNETIPLRNVISLAASPGRLWALTFGPARPELLYSSDGGVNWTSVALPAGIPPVLPAFLTAHPANPDVLYLAAGTSLISTRNAGETWAVRSFTEPVGLVALDDRAVAVFTAQYGNRFVMNTFKLQWSDDGGETFAKTLSLTQPIQAMKFDPNEPGRLYVADFARFARTAPGTFPEFETLYQVGMQPPVTLFGFQSALPGVIFASFADGRLQRSEDGGRTWRPASTAIPVGGFTPPPTQLVVGAGGVVHLAQPSVPQGFLGKLAASGDFAYLTYLGGPGTLVNALSRTPSGLVVATGQALTGDFPGERLGGIPGPFPPGVTPPPIPGIFALAFREDTGVAYSVVLASSGPANLFWAGPGAGSTMMFFGVLYTPDFPGVPIPSSGFFNGPQLFLARLRP